MRDRLAAARDVLAPFLEEYLAGQAQEFAHVNSWSSDVCGRLQRFVAGGKMIRGCLVVVLAGMLGADEQDAVRAGAAMELLQSGVLVHDDIMDGDSVRRGQPALHAQFSQMHGERFGLGAGICAGDVSLFMSFDLLNGCARAQALIDVFVRETVSLGLGQVQDVYLGESGEEPSVDDILSVYRYKTGRYTFSLPFLLAATLADREDLCDSLAAFGEEVGVVFQVRDDEIGLFGDEQSIGKPIGADVREDKRTLYRFELFRLAEGEDAHWLRSVFGSDVSDADMARIRSIAEDVGVRSAVRLHVESADARAQAVLDDLQVPVQVRELLDWLMRFNRSRVA